MAVSIIHMIVPIVRYENIMDQLSQISLMVTLMLLLFSLKH